MGFLFITSKIFAYATRTSVYYEMSSGGPKFRDFSQFSMNFQKIQKKIWKVQADSAPLHSSNIQKPHPIGLEMYWLFLVLA